MVSNATFMVDLASLSHAIGKVSAESETIKGKLRALGVTLDEVSEKWKGPAGTTYVAPKDELKSVGDRFVSVLDDAVGRMRTTYHTYVSIEEANTRNLK
jgi:uncharacterized protein YukE